jgi:hypothetical protein
MIDPKNMQRPLGYAFDQFLIDGCKGKIQPSEYVHKKDGFHLKIERAHGGVFNTAEGILATRITRLYTSNGDFPIQITDKPSNVMEAIVWHMITRFPLIGPDNIKWHGTRPVWRISVEFVAKKKDSPHAYLKGLYLKECIDPQTGMLNETDFTYHPTLFDFRLNPKGNEPGYIQRAETIRESLEEIYLGSDVEFAEFLPISSKSASEIIGALLDEEGLVVHHMDRSVRKVKLPKVVMKARIVAAANDIDGFMGFTHFLIAVPESPKQWRVIHAWNWKPLFVDYNRIKQHRAFVNQHSVKIVSGRLTCTSSSTLCSMVDAVFHAVSKAKCFPPMSITKTSAVARFVDEGPITYKCGVNRSFSFLDAGYQFLADPVDVILGAGELWELQGAEIHLQPAWLLAVYGESFGHPAYKEIQKYTPLDTLVHFARTRLDPHSMYAHVGMTKGPFLGMEEEFCASMTYDKLEIPYACI